MIARYAQYLDTGTPWLDGIPEGWQMGRLNQVARAWTSNVDKHSVEGQLPVRLCNYTDVYKNDFILGDMDFMRATATPEQVVRFRLKRGDTIITKDSETADDIGIPTYVEYEAEDLICGYHLAMIRPDQRVVDSRFLYWQMTSKPVRGQWEVLAAGVTRVGIRSTDLAKVAIVKPPLNEQRAIADFLDREVARIDALVGEQEGLVQVLRERRSALITRAVTKGLDATASMSETGVPSLGEIPAHWRVQRVKHLGRAIIGLTYSPDDIVDSEQGGTLVLRAGNVQHGRVVLGDNVYVSTLIPAGLRTRAGDILICARNGSARLIGKNAIIGDGAVGETWGAFMAVLRSPSNFYLRWILNSQLFTSQIGMFSTSTINQLTSSTLHNLDIAVPPVSEQRQISDFLDEKTEKIDALISEAEGVVAVVKERRSALITAAVTGQIDVRGEVA